MLVAPATSPNITPLHIFAKNKVANKNKEYVAKNNVAN